MGMKGAQKAVLEALKDVESSLNPPSCDVYMNVTAKAMPAGSSPKDIIKLLGEQLVNPVMWEQSMVAAIKDGCTEFFELGPNKQLRAMMKRIDPKASEKMTNVAA